MWLKNLFAAIILAICITSTTNLAGELTEDTTWSGTVIVDSNVIIPAGIVLTVEPGTTVQMKDAVRIKVYGQLLADGNEAKPIRFTRYASGMKWRHIIFIEAADSRLTNCIIEYGGKAGSHTGYYDPWLPRDYNEAVVALACHVDFEKCVFQKLPTTGGEGDAIAIVSDDLYPPGSASANFRSCRFLDIGQGIHTRYAYVQVEDCYFQHKNGDNDDVDLYGESPPGFPPCLIRNNLFDVPEDDDRINPTKCSVVIIGNIIKGSNDHGIVLRDKGSPIVMNNVIANCSSGGIAVENSCTATLVNNTIVNCGRGLRLFDLGRADHPYHLTPGGGTATVINCIIWGDLTTQPITLADSSNTTIPDRGSHITVMYSDVKNGRAGVSVSGTYSTVMWGDGNINADPQFVDPNYHLKSQAGHWDQITKSWILDAVTSLCIDAGDPNSDWTAELWPHGKRINMGAYGGTPEASLSLSNAGNIGDLDNNGTVDFQDLAQFAAQWETQRPLLREDLDRNKIVDCNDLSIFVDNWLSEN